MAFLDRVLDPPSYGYLREGKLYIPSHQEILKEFFSRLNIFSTRKNWISLFSWFAALVMAVPLILFLRYAFSWPLVIAGFFYSMVFMGTHGTIWLHRYSTHRAFTFRNNFFKFLCRNLVIKLIPEEIYVLSHYVHHRSSEKPGDPYNVHAGWLYCFLADVNHQTLRKDLSEKEYDQACKLLNHTGMYLNTFKQYQYWGSVCHPLMTIGHYLLNWSFWYGAFFLIGGHALSLALFGAAGVWGIGVRTFNFEGHGKGKNLQQEGIDFYKGDLSVNQLWPGYVAGEWHNNHHLYPQSACCGFLPYQLDLAWLFIWSWSKLGFITRYRNCKPEFIRDHYLPYLKQNQGVRACSNYAS